MSKPRVLLNCLLSLCVLSLPAWTQSSLGTIVGTVTDNSGAVVPGATVTITNEGTQAQRQTTTEESGSYTAPALPPGLYTVKVDKTSFAAQLQQHLTLQVDQTLRANFSLQVGSVNQAVEVNAASEQLQTDTATIGTEIDNKQVLGMPLNGRNYTQLTTLVPGAVAGGGSTGVLIGNVTSVSITGMRGEYNNYTLDGVDANDIFFKVMGIQPSIDAIQEFKVLSNMSSAQYGQTAGANISVVTKSGSNDFHGSLYEFHRDDVLADEDFFSQLNKVPTQVFRQNQYGGTLGGPIVKNNTFFFVSYEGFRESRNSSNVTVVPTAAQLGGDFSKDYLGNANPQLYNPYSVIGHQADGTPIRAPFANNYISPTFFNPSSLALVKTFFPSSNISSAQGNYLNTQPNVINSDQGIIRGDHRFGDKNTLTGRYAKQNSSNIQPGSVPANSVSLINNFTNALIADTHTFNPTTVLDVRLGYNRNYIINAPEAPGGAAATNAFISDYGIQGLPGVYGIPLYPTTNIGGFASINQAGNPFVDDTYQLRGALTKTLNRQTLSFGAETDYMRNYTDGWVTGDITYDQAPTSQIGGSGATGLSLASFLLGLPSTANRNLGETEADMREHNYSWYVQDDVHLTKNLTLNVGLRWDYFQWPYARDNNLSSFDLDNGQWYYPKTNPVTGGPPTTSNRSIANPNYLNFAPRFGLAYRLGEKTTIRAGYGIFYEGNYLWEAQGIRGNWPYAISQTLTDINSTNTPVPIQTVFSPNLGITPGSTVPPSAQHIVNRNSKTSYVQQWNFTVQRQLARDLMLEVGYVGNGGRHESIYASGNNAPPGPGDVDPRRPYNLQNTASLPPNQQFSGGTSIEDNVASSDYNGLTTKLDKRFSHGLQAGVNFAWSKVINVGGDCFSCSGGPQDPFNYNLDRSVSDLYRKFVFSSNYTWQLPFGKGQPFLSNMNGIGNALLGGWQVTGIISATSGSPFSVQTCADIANYGDRDPCNQRANLVGDQYAGARQVPSISNPTAVTHWLNPAAFVTPPAYTFGTSGRNIAIGPNFFDWDLGAFKTFKITERFTFELRGEIFNLLNNTNFAAPTAACTCQSPSQFATITGLASNPREEQVAAKITF